jgi:hypothetical protein
VTASLLLLALAAGPADIDETLSRRYADWDAAYLATDVDALRSMTARGFRVVTGSGRAIDRETYFKDLRDSSPPDEYRTGLLRAARRGGTAVCWTEESSRDIGGPAHVHRYRDVWRRAGGQWLLEESRTLEER